MALKKILILSPCFPAIFGGVSDYVGHLYSNIPKSEAEVFVLTSDNKLINSNKDDHVICAIDRWNIFSIPKMLGIINRIKPDVINIQYVPYLYSHYGIPMYMALLGVLLKIWRYSLVVTFHEIFIPLELGQPKYWGIGLVQRFVACVLSFLSTTLIVSSSVYQNALGVYKNKAHIVPVGSNILPVDISDTDLKNFRNSLGNEFNFVITTFGYRPRREEILIKVLEKLKTEGINIKFLILGNFSKEWIRKIQEQADNLGVSASIFVGGRLDNANLFKYLAVSDLFVIIEAVDDKGRSGVSSSSGSVAAAFAAGLPVLGTKGNRTDNFFVHGKNIYLLDELNENSIVEAVKKIFCDLELRERLRLGSRQTYETKLSWNVIAREYLKLFEEDKSCV